MKDSVLGVETSCLYRTDEKPTDLNITHVYKNEFISTDSIASQCQKEKKLKHFITLW